MRQAELAAVAIDPVRDVLPDHSAACLLQGARHDHRKPPMAGKPTTRPRRQRSVSSPQLWKLVATEAEVRRSSTDGFLRPLLTDQRARVIIAGAGTSAFAGQVLAPALTDRLHRRVRRRRDHRYRVHPAPDPRRGCADAAGLAGPVGRQPGKYRKLLPSPTSCCSTVRHVVITRNRHGQLGRLTRHEPIRSCCYSCLPRPTTAASP